MTAGPLTQWELIFYGTETPPQEYDASPDSNTLGGGTNLANEGAGLSSEVHGGGAVPPPWGGVSDTDSGEGGQSNTLGEDLTLVSWHSHTVSS